MLPWSVSEVRELDSRAALLDAAHKAGMGAVLAVAAGVLVVGLGSYGWAIAVAAATVYPLLRFGLARLAHGRPAVVPGGESGDQARPALCAPPLHACSTSELADAWGVSHRLLETTSSPVMRARLAALRGEYLDELERRDKAGVQRWLASGAQAAHDLGRFLRHRDEGGEPTPDVR